MRDAANCANRRFLLSVASDERQLGGDYSTGRPMRPVRGKEPGASRERIGREVASVDGVRATRGTMTTPGYRLYRVSPAVPPATTRAASLAPTPASPTPPTPPPGRFSRPCHAGAPSARAHLRSREGLAAHRPQRRVGAGTNPDVLVAAKLREVKVRAERVKPSNRLDVVDAHPTN